MAMSATVVANGSNTGINASYIVNSVSTVGSLQSYNIAMNGSLGSPQGTLQNTADFVYLSNGTITSITLNGQNGSLYGFGIITALLVPFYLEFGLNAIMGYMTSDLAQVNTTKVTLGSTTLSVTNYDLAHTPFTSNECGVNTTINSGSVQVGKVPGSNFGNLLTYVGFTGIIPGGLSSVVFRVTSIQTGSVTVSTSS
jgi:hypothetical protein